MKIMALGPLSFFLVIGGGVNVIFVPSGGVFGVCVGGVGGGDVVVGGIPLRRGGLAGLAILLRGALPLSLALLGGTFALAISPSVVAGLDSGFDGGGEIRGGEPGGCVHAWLLGGRFGGVTVLTAFSGQRQIFFVASVAARDVAAFRTEATVWVALVAPHVDVVYALEAGP